MKSAKLSGEAGSETRVAILDSGEEAFATLTKFANDAGITAASLTAIGAFESATVGWFDFEKKTCKRIEVAEQCEVLSAIDDIAVGDDGKASLHVHVVLGLADGSTRGGHLRRKGSADARGRHRGNASTAQTQEIALIDLATVKT